MKKTLFSALALAAVSLAGAQTVRNLVVVDTEGNSVEIPGSKIEAITFEDAPESIKLTTLLATGYEAVDALGMYRVEFGTGEADADGLPAEIGDMQVALLMAGPWSDDVKNPKLPVGKYGVGNSTQEFTFDINQSTIWVRTEAGPDGVSPLMIIDGSVDVRVDASGNYKIQMNLMPITGSETYVFTYQGPLQFAAGYGAVQPFDKDVNLDFSVGQGRFYGNWFYPFAADMLGQFFQGTIEDGVFKDGYVLEISLYVPKSDDEMAPNKRFIDGTYSVETREAVAYEYLPFRYDAGQQVEVMGQEYITKTRLEYYGSDGSRKLGLIKGGTFTVSDNGTKFVFDFTTAEGVSVKGTYSGNPYVQNYCDNDEKAPKRPYSLLTEDVALNFQPGTVCIGYNDGHRVLDDANFMTVWFVCPGEAPGEYKGDYLWMDLFSDGDTLADGTYTVNQNPAAGVVVPGVYDYARTNNYTWYADMDKLDDEGYNTWMAPIAGGTVTISTEADGQRKFVFNFVDDAGYKITGEYTCHVVDGNAQDAAAHVAKMRKQASREIRLAPMRKK